MMKGEIIDDGILSQSCNLCQEIMFFMPLLLEKNLMLPAQKKKIIINKQNLCLWRTPQR